MAREILKVLGVVSLVVFIHIDYLHIKYQSNLRTDDDAVKLTLKFCSLEVTGSLAADVPVARVKQAELALQEGRHL